MTINHTFIRSLVLSASLIFAAQAHAEPRSVLVTYFNVVLYKNAAPPASCGITDDMKFNWLEVFNQKKCFLRSGAQDDKGQVQLYISGIAPACKYEDIKKALDTNITLACNTAAANKGSGTPAQQQANQGTGNAGGSNGSAAAAAGTGAVQQAINIATQNQQRVATNPIYGNGSTNNNSGANNNSGTVGAANNNTNKPNGPATTTSNNQRTAAPATPGTPASNTPAEDAAVTKATASYNEVYALQKELNCKDPKNVNVESCKSLARELQSRQNQLDNATEAQRAAQEAQAKKAKEEANESVRTASPEQRQAANTNVLGDAAQAAAAKPSEATAQSNTKADEQVATDNSNVQAAGKPVDTTGAVAPVNCMAQKQAVEAAYGAYNSKKSICVKGANTAYNFCDKANSPGLKQVQQFVSLGATALSNMTAATDACRTTSTISKVAQAGVLGAQVLCTTTKIACDKGCAAAATALGKVKTAVAELKTCEGTVQTSAQAKLDKGNGEVAANNPQGPVTIQEAQHENTHAQTVAKSSAEYESLIKIEEAEATLTENVGSDGKPDGSKKVTGGSDLDRSTKLCKEKAAVDIALMGSAAVGLLSAFVDAEKCKEQLASNGGSGGTTTSGVAVAAVTTAEYCAIPDNASTVTCKCTADPNAAGCVGGMANSGVLLGKVDSGSGASGFASAKQNGLGSLSSSDKHSTVAGEAASGTGLSAAAREALGMGSVESAGGSGGGAASFAAGSDAAKAKGKNAEEPKKFGFFSSVAAMLSGGRKPDSAAKAAIRSYEQDQAIQRKIASEKVRAEVTTASGKSNFDKIKSAYKSNMSSFEQ